MRQGIKARRTRNEGRVRRLEAMRREFGERRSRQGTAKLSTNTAEAQLDLRWSGKLQSDIRFQLTEESVGGFYVSPGISTERIELFCAEVDSSTAGGIHGVAEEGEEIRVVVMPAPQAIAELFRRIDSTGPIILMQWFAANRARLRRDWAGIAHSD